MTPSFFVTGTDTGVGKSIVAAALLAALRGAGHDAVPMKPVQTGCPPGATPPDLALALAASNLRPSPEEIACMAPYRFPLPASPHLAARHAGVEVSKDKILQAFGQLRARHAGVVVEGAGGLLVPLNERETMLDLAVALGLPLLVVARPGLGTLNHTLLTVREAARAGLPTRAVVLSAATDSPWSDIEEDNARTLARMAAPATVLRFPHVKANGLARAGREHLAPLFQ